MRRANGNDRPFVVGILTESFNENKSVNYVVRPGKGRKERIKKLMEYSFNVCNAFGEVWISDDKQACALILLPDRKTTSIRTIIWDAKLAISVIGLSRINAVLKRESEIKSFHPQEPICYLWFIGVNPHQQHKGIGSIFIREVIEECERKKRSIYLETSVVQNLSWYQKFGFEIFHSLELSYTLYLLRRLYAR
jgi:ribosomal protein S18 acetylase RimI-like enzyme